MFDTGTDIDLATVEITDLDANPGETESEVESREVPTEDFVVKSVGGRKKRHRGRHIAAGRSGKSK
jgi:hypothetical protein